MNKVTGTLTSDRNFPSVLCMTSHKLSDPQLHDMQKGRLKTSLNCGLEIM